MLFLPISLDFLSTVEIRLVDGSVDGSGRVEVYHAGRWGTICDDGWDSNEANVVCHMFNYSIGLARTHARFGAGERMPIWMDGLECSGSENSVFDCARDPFGEGDCTHNEDASVICKNDCKI